jgi:hypothetical protein
VVNNTSTAKMPIEVNGIHHTPSVTESRACGGEVLPSLLSQCEADGQRKHSSDKGPGSDSLACESDCANWEDGWK